MFDTRIRLLIDPPLAAAGRWLAHRGIGADAVTLAGFAFGMAAALAIVWGGFAVALALIAASRLADGLDGAIARATTKTDRGGFLDIVLDFIFYAFVPLAFALHDPAANALAAAVLLASFSANGSAFLAFAIMIERAKLAPSLRGSKSFYFMSGLAEGTETIVAFVLFCLLPSSFAVIAYGLAALTFTSAIGRLLHAWRTLG